MVKDRSRTHREFLDKALAQEIASQIPVHATRASYARMLNHCIVQDQGNTKNLWACALTGAKVIARFVHTRILDEAGLCIEYSPVATLYCSGCDPVPNTHSGDSIASSAIQTLSM